MCKEYHSIAGSLMSHTYLEVRDVTRFSNERTNEIIEYANQRDNINPYVEYYNVIRPSIVASPRANESSYSPWKYVINRDKNR